MKRASIPTALKKEPAIPHKKAKSLLTDIPEEYVARAGAAVKVGFLEQCLNKISLPKLRCGGEDSASLSFGHTSARTCGEQPILLGRGHSEKPRRVPPLTQAENLVSNRAVCVPGASVPERWSSASRRKTPVRPVLPAQLPLRARYLRDSKPCNQQTLRGILSGTSSTDMSAASSDDDAGTTAPQRSVSAPEYVASSDDDVGAIGPQRSISTPEYSSSILDPQGEPQDQVGKCQRTEPSCQIEQTQQIIQEVWQIELANRAMWANNLDDSTWMQDVTGARLDTIHSIVNDIFGADAADGEPSDGGESN